MTLNENGEQSLKQRLVTDQPVLFGLLHEPEIVGTSPVLAIFNKRKFARSNRSRPC